MSMIDAMKARKSVRRYAEEELNEERKKTIGKRLQEVGHGVFGNHPQFAFIEKALANKEEKVKLGTYGFIQGAKYFIAGAVQKNENAEVDFGYLMERVVLEMTAMQLGTCWIGGTFRREDYFKVMNVSSETLIPAIVSVGASADRRSTLEKLVRWQAKSDSRKPWKELFFNRDLATPLSETEAGAYTVPLEMLRIAPSASNKQPWRIVKDGNAFHFFLERTKGYRKLVPSVDLQQIDMGIAMRHFEEASKESGLMGAWIKADKKPDVKDALEYIITWSVKTT